MKTDFTTPQVTLEELSHRVEALRRTQQSDKDKAVKHVQAQIDDLRAELSELQDLVLEALKKAGLYE